MGKVKADRAQEVTGDKKCNMVVAKEGLFGYDLEAKSHPDGPRVSPPAN